MKKILKKTLKKLLKSKKDLAKERRHSLVGKAYLWKMKQQFQIDFLIGRGLNKWDNFLDIGCGTLRGGIPVIRYLNNEKYYGIDIRKEVIDEALKELDQEKLNSKKPKLASFKKFSDSELDFNLTFDVIFAFSVLIHMSDDILDNCLEYVAKKISDHGVFYANVNVGKNKEGNWQGFPVVFRSLDYYENIAYKYNLKIEVLSSLKELGHETKKLDDEQVMLSITKKI